MALSSEQVRLQNNVRRVILKKKNILAKTPNETLKTSCMLPECVRVSGEKGPGGPSPASCRRALSRGLLAAGVAEEGHAAAIYYFFMVLCRFLQYKEHMNSEL